MWIFGYGSLMWDGWEEGHGCVRRATAELDGYTRVFNKPSVRNWGTREWPCPTLNLREDRSSVCRGVGFEFPEPSKNSVMEYLIDREGKDFVFLQKTIRVDDRSVLAAVPMYVGKSLLKVRSASELLDMISKADGRDGSCAVYIESVVKKLAELGINDPVVTETWRAIREARRLTASVGS